MKKVYFTVGPSEIYPTVYKHLRKGVEQDILSLSHRGVGFKEIFKSASVRLKKLLNVPSNFQIFFVSSALESMERTTQNCCATYSFHIITGSFGKTWANIARDLGKNTSIHIISNNENILVSDLKIPKETEIICVTQNDTSTGFWMPPLEIVKLKKKNPEKLIAVDLVSSAPFVDLDFKYIDIAFFSVQKGFGLPAGLGVIIVNPKALEKTQKLLNQKNIIGSYHNFKCLSENAGNFQTPETPNVLNIYLLNQVLKDMLKIGIEKIRQQTKEKAKMLYETFEHLKFEPYIKHPAFRSPTTIVIDVKGQSETIRKRLAKKGFYLGAGYGDNKLNHIRIANFPAHTLKDVKSMLNSSII